RALRGGRTASARGGRRRPRSRSTRSPASRCSSGPRRQGSAIPPDGGLSTARGGHPTRCMRSGGQKLLGRLDQLAWIEGLADEAARAARLRLLLGRFVHLAAEHHDRDRTDAVALLHPAQHLPAVYLRHHHVEQDEVGRLLLERLEPLLRTPGLADGVALEL